MVVLSVLNDPNLQLLLTHIPPHIQIQNLKILTKELILKTQPDLIILETSYFRNAETPTDFLIEFVEDTILWGCKEDDLKQVVPLVEAGDPLLHLPHKYRKTV